MSRSPQNMGSQNGRNNRNNMVPSQMENRGRWLLGIVILVIIAVIAINYLDAPSTTKSLPYTTFISQVKAHDVKSATINNATGVVTGELKDGVKYTVNGPVPYLSSEITAIKSNGVNYGFVTPQSSILGTILGYVILALIFAAVWIYISRRTQSSMSNVMSIGKSRAKAYSPERPKTTFDDIAGYSGVKSEVSEIVDFLSNPARFADIGARIPKGILLVGPPGTGKTLLAKAVAGEAGVPFMSVSGSDFMEMFVGVGASRVRDLFQTARKSAPSIIFIDEIDSIGRKRGTGLGGGHDEREQTLNQMLSEMDGFDPAEGVVVMAATNRPDILDPALLRPGRFDRQVVVPLPDLDERAAILRVHAREKKMGMEIDWQKIAKGTPGMSGADLANLVNEAALNAVRRGSKIVDMEDFEYARDRVLMGQRRESTVLSDDEKERVAYHEGGHAVLAYVLDYADPLHKVTILPIGMALGVTQQLPEERHIYPMEHILDSIVVRMGGRVAEMLVYGDLSTGASNDLVGNTELAKRMVREWGMSAKLGPMAWGSQGVVFLGEDLMHSAEYSDETASVIDAEVDRILREQEARATELLRTHLNGLKLVAEALLERETVTGAEVAELVDKAHGEAVHPDGKKPTGISKLREFTELALPVGSNSAHSTTDLPPTD